MATAVRQVDPSLRRAGVVAVVLGVIAIAIALFVGLGGLTQNPVKGTDATGTTTLSGTFEPMECGGDCVEGYVQAGARSVFVVFAANCTAPARGSNVTVRGRLDSALGSATYRATDCG